MSLTRGVRSAGRIVRLGVLWCCGLVLIVYVPALWMIDVLGRCFLDGEDSLLCTDAGGWAVMLLPVVVLPVTLVVGSRSALRDSGRGWGVWAACVAALAAVGGAYAYLGRLGSCVALPHSAKPGQQSGR